MTKPITIYFGLITTIVFGLISCDPMDTRLKVINNTNDTLFCFDNTDDNSYYTGNNPLNGQLIINGQDTALIDNWNSLMFPNDTSTFADYDWEDRINDSKTKKLYLHIYRPRLFYGKDRIIKDPIKNDTMMSFTYEELEKRKWRIQLKN